MHKTKETADDATEIVFDICDGCASKRKMLLAWNDKYYLCQTCLKNERKVSLDSLRRIQQYRRSQNAKK
jgi:hypothetical protein